ncbi:MAG: pseudouridine synthase, partial [Candidatus Gallimonas sp.]
MRRYCFCVGEPCARTDVFLCERMEGVTRSAIKRLADEEHIFVNGQPARAGQALRTGDRVEAEIPDPRPATARAQDIPIDVVYEDADLAVVNKPQGMTVHAGNGNTEGTLVNALLFRLDSLSGVGGAIRPGIVHRIDKDTSGLLVVAKNDRAH